MKRLFKFFAFLLLIVGAYYAYTIYPKLDIVSGFSSKSVASHLFIADRSQEYTEKEDNEVPSMNLASNEVDERSKSVSSTALGIKTRKAIYREGVGAVLVPNNATIKQDTYLSPNRDKTPKNLVYPYGDLPQKDTLFSNIDYKNLKTAVNDAFIDTDFVVKKTRSVLVVYKDQIVAEQYASGFDKNSMLLGWSMTKSVTSAVLGVMEKQGMVKLNQTGLFKEWGNDDRKNITLSNVLNMNSGLEWEEDYTKICDVTKMLFIEPEMTTLQLNKPLIGQPNNSWNYSSGTTNLLSGFIRNQFKSHQEYLDFWYSDLIDKIGMYSMLIETDYSGNYVGSSYGWATTRDWAKFGLLYLHNGNWNGEQILNESWIDFTKEPTNGSNGVYGGHFWMNAGGKYPDVPKDMYSCNGFQGQRLYIIPSKNLVVLRMGIRGESSFNVNEFLSEIIESIE